MTSAPRLAFVGDLVPSRPLPPAAELGQSTDAVFAALRDADIAFGDLEMPMSTRGAAQEKLIAFRGDPSLAKDLPRMGFDVLSLATNHSMDFGPLALADTLEKLAELGIDTCGAGRNRDAAERLIVRLVDGVRIGFLAWSGLLPVGSAASEKRAGIAPIHIHSSYEVDAYTQMEEPGNPPRVRTRPDEDDLERVVARIADAKDKVDFLVVSIHWGFGSTSTLAEYQQILGHKLVDAGADLVLGAHVHALQGIELYKDRVIAYGVGNFIAQQPREGLSGLALQILDEMSRDALLAIVDLDADGGYEFSCTPVMTGVDGLPAVPSQDDVERIRGEMQALSAGLDTKVSLDRPGVVSLRGRWNAVTAQ